MRTLKNIPQFHPQKKIGKINKYTPLTLNLASLHLLLDAASLSEAAGGGGLKSISRGTQRTFSVMKSQYRVYLRGARGDTWEESLKYRLKPVPFIKRRAEKPRGLHNPAILVFARH